MTTPDPLFTVTDVQAISGEVYEEPELTQVNQFIAIASAKLRSRVSKLDERIATGALDPVLVKGVGAEIVLRALAALERGVGVRRVEYPEWSTEYESGGSSGRLVYVTDDDVADLIDTESTGDAFTIRTGLI
ncbi:hypothetical protein GV794_01940 [Nocardia cyriacigeorgica]|uniref:Uncharacterized protein n=1 Tax=Nocardia cyriacigeorgica TaxID=135487 RepID=A0ABX0CGN8_9NOCA|nr:hypothetical protein [Nocardia cyriacigeorgica]NEW40784.1 hypothetical protein [Nocardia cyriacigeorgica]NEW50990.1 hypothetical protein [Nocardia cyriacigeorgica]NEW54427.1 hypothetical protein [Nocardia cyriacigeorgica]